MLIIGIDPGSVSCGIGILKKEQNRLLYVHSEEVKLAGRDLTRRMKQLWIRLAEINGKYSPDQAAVESGFLQTNVKTLQVLAQFQGVILASFLDRDLPVRMYSPREVKQFVTGNGNALKFQVKKMISILLNLDEERLGEDESDGLAVAYCHGMRHR